MRTALTAIQAARANCFAVVGLVLLLFLVLWRLGWFRTGLWRLMRISAGRNRGYCVFDQIDYETLYRAGSRRDRAPLGVGRGQISAHDLSFAHFKAQKSEIRFVVLLESETISQRQGRWRLCAVDRLKCPQVGIAAGSGDHVGNLQRAFGALYDIGEALVVVHMARQN